MSKKNVVILICFLFLYKAYPQTYTSLIDTNKLWYVLQLNDCPTIGGCYSTDIYKFQKDTIIDIHKYYQLVVFDDSTITNYRIQKIFLREDTINKKVFYIYNDNPEELLYDFTIGEHDTIIINNQYHINQLVVDSIDYITINNIERKRIIFKEREEGYLIEEWIEGIGSNYGIINVSLKFIGLSYELLCVHEDNSVIYQNPKYSSCYLSTVGINPVEKTIDEISLYPNPVIDESRLLFSGKPNEKYTIEVYDILGEKVYNNYFLEQFSLLINNVDYSSGIYIVKIYNRAGIVVKSKFHVL